MFVEACLLSLGLYAGSKLCGKTAPKLQSDRSHQKEAPLQKFKKQFLDPFIGNTREQHQKAITNRKPGIGKAERQAKKDFKTASLSLACASVGLIGFPIFYAPAVLLVSYQWLHISKKAYEALFGKHRINFDVIMMLSVILALGGGFFFELACANWFYALIQYLIVKTEDHSQRSLSGLFGEQPRFVWMLVDGVEVRVAFEQIRVGDIIVVSAGEAISVDGVITQGVALIDQHMLTGESQPMEKIAGDSVLMGTVLLSGRIQVRVEKTGKDTVAAQVGEILTKTTDFREHLQTRAVAFVDRIGLPMTVFAGVTWKVLGLSQALGVFMTYPGFRMYLLDPLSMLSFLHVASQDGILIKDGRSLELLNKIDTVVFDKTGTLTLERPEVCQIFCNKGFGEDEVLVHAATAERKQTHPIARAILSAHRERGLDLPEIDDADYHVGYGIAVKAGGHVIRVGSQRFMAESEISVPTHIRRHQTRCYEIGHSMVMVALDEALIGAIELKPVIRPGTEAIIRQLKARKLDLFIISGDHEHPTRHLAEELGIDRHFSQVLPEDKAELVAGLERDGRSVCFVGDGINDAIALKKATVSVSLRGATTIATDTAQIVLMDAHLNQLIRMFELAESYHNNLKVNFAASTLPFAVYTAGAYAFGWTFFTAIMIQQLTTFLGLYNVARPLIDEGKRDDISESSDPNL